MNRDNSKDLQRYFGGVLQLLLVSSIAILLPACSTPTQRPAPAPVTAETNKNLSTLQELAQLKEEIRRLQNSVEEIQFDTKNIENRQQDLYQDIDRRMSEIERNQQATATGNLSGYDQVTSSGDTSVGSNAVITRDTETSINNPPINNSGDQSNQTVSVAEQQAYEVALNLLKQSRYNEAIDAFSKQAQTWPQGQLADDAWYWMSEARYVNREFAQALTGFRNVVRLYPDSQRVPEALLKIGYIQYDIGSYDEAAATFRDILARYPGHQVTSAAQTRLHRIEKTIQKSE